MAEIKPIEKQVDELVRKLSVIKDREIDYGVARSLNRTLRAGRTEVAKEVRAKTKLPSKLIKSRMYEKRASAGDQTAALRMYTRPVPAISLPNVRDTGRLLRDKRGRFAGRKGRGVRARGGFHYPDRPIRYSPGRPPPHSTALRSRSSERISTTRSSRSQTASCKGR